MDDALMIDADSRDGGPALLASLEIPEVLGPLPRSVCLDTEEGIKILCAIPADPVHPRAATKSIRRLLAGRSGVSVWRVASPVPTEQLPPLPPLWLAAIQGAGDLSERRGPPSIDDPVDWGKYKGDGTYREMAARSPSYCAWAARTIGGLKGQLCAEALAVHLGVA